MTKTVETLICCCCGEHTLNRQWWNRDTGFGLCRNCADQIAKIEDSDTMKECYGVKGYHYCIDIP